MTTTTVELHTTILESAYFRMAQGEDLTADEQAALEIVAPDRETLEKNMDRCKRVPELQANAGTSADRKAAKEKLAKLESDLPAQIDELNRVIRGKQKEIARLERAKGEQSTQIRIQESAVEALRDREVPKFIQQRYSVAIVKTKPLRDRRNDIRHTLGDLDRLHALKPGDADFALVHLNEIAEDAGVDGVLIRDCSRDLDNGGRTLDYHIDSSTLAEAKKATSKNRNELRAEYEQILADIDRMTAEANQLLNFYVPE